MSHVPTSPKVPRTPLSDPGPEVLVRGVGFGGRFGGSGGPGGPRGSKFGGGAGRGSPGARVSSPKTCSNRWVIREHPRLERRSPVEGSTLPIMGGFPVLPPMPPKTGGGKSCRWGGTIRYARGGFGGPGGVPGVVFGGIFEWGAAPNMVKRGPIYGAGAGGSLLGVFFVKKGGFPSGRMVQLGFGGFRGVWGVPGGGLGGRGPGESFRGGLERPRSTFGVLVESNPVPELGSWVSFVGTGGVGPSCIFSTFIL